MKAEVGNSLPNCRVKLKRDQNNQQAKNKNELKEKRIRDAVPATMHQALAEPHRRTRWGRENIMMMKKRETYSKCQFLKIRVWYIVDPSACLCFPSTQTKVLQLITCTDNNNIDAMSERIEERENDCLSGRHRNSRHRTHEQQSTRRCDDPPSPELRIPQSALLHFLSFRKQASHLRQSMCCLHILSLY